MRKILHDLYRGRYTAWERKIVRSDENIALVKKIESEKQYFVQKMSIEDSKRFDELDNLYIQSSDCEQEDAFAYGFKLGMMLLCVVFTDGEEPAYD